MAQSFFEQLQDRKQSVLHFAEKAAEEFRSFNVEAESCADLEAAVRLAAVRAKERGVPLVCLGSLYMYADVKRTFRLAEKTLFRQEN